MGHSPACHKTGICIIKVLGFRVKTQPLGECYVVLMQGAVSSKACQCKYVILDAVAAKQMLLRKSES